MKDYCQTNYLQPTGFRVLINKERYPYLSFSAQSIQHPSMEIGETKLGRPRLAGVPFIGDQIVFASLSMDVLLDENMEVYSEIYTWMENMVETKHKLSSFDNPSLSDYCDISIALLTSSNNKNKEFRYVNAFPVTLGDVQMNAASEETFITCPMTFAFDYFEIL